MSSSTTKHSRCHAALNRCSLFSGLLAAALTLAGCGSEIEYAYFSVQVSIDRATVPDELRRKIASCVLVVEGDDTDFVSLPCTLNSVPYELGKAEFSTDERRGQLVFTAIMRDLNGVDLARGSSAPVAIVPNVNLETSVVAKAVQSADAGMGGDANAPDAGGLDAGAGDANGPDADSADVAVGG